MTNIWINPVFGEITSLFGYRYNPVLHDVYEFHNGIDIAVVEGTNVYAVKDGMITEIRYSPTLGNLLRFTTYSGYEVMYAHLNEVLVELGAQVYQGQVVATSGNTGLSSGPHLHYSIWYNNELVEPLHYVELPFSSWINS